MNYGLELYVIEFVIQIIRWPISLQRVNYILQLYELQCTVITQDPLLPWWRPESRLYISITISVVLLLSQMTYWMKNT